MADRQNHSLKPLPMANYSPAIARAVEWLGDRYLLAKPNNVSAHRGAAKPATVATVATVATWRSGVRTQSPDDRSNDAVPRSLPVACRPAVHRSRH
jgi:hypothetical protein